jgi:hypothetical protein
MYQLGFYAMDQANQWKTRILSKWPHLENRLYTLELCERNFGYSILRRLTKGVVSGRWGKDLIKDTLDERLSRQLFVRETVSNRTLLRNFKKETGIDENKYVAFVYAVDRKGMVSFRACGFPTDEEMDIMGQALVDNKT